MYRYYTAIPRWMGMVMEVYGSHERISHSGQSPTSRYHSRRVFPSLDILHHLHFRLRP